jgi:hypothetical protein
LVKIVDDWDALVRYARDKEGFYQILGGPDAPEIRVLAGKVGFIREFKCRDDPLLNAILEFCRSKSYIKVSESVMEEFFFK